MSQKGIKYEQIACIQYMYSQDLTVFKLCDSTSVNMSKDFSQCLNGLTGNRG